MIKIIIAIMLIESGGIDTAIGDGGKAVGCLQIHKIYVDDVNRIIGHKRFRYEDRLSRRHSIAMTAIYLSHWCVRRGRTDYLTTHQAGPQGL